MVKFETKFETIPEHIIQMILEYFQTKKMVKNAQNLLEHDFNKLIISGRKSLVNGKGIKTDIKSILNFSMVCKRFREIIRGDTGKLLLTVHYNLETGGDDRVLQHISYCHDSSCRNVCHYVIKDIKHTNILKKIAINEFNKLKKICYDENLVSRFFKHLSQRQIESYESYCKIKKMRMKLKNNVYENKTTETCEFFESTELDSFSPNPD